ncbi:RagB/SusD family nutrient uptake outer membrane protein [Aequorivita sp. Q41]|uniref:RagB/SusD family nutrient uptake outer membrane protein n=1 Tax=Aequorivita sp. Q41 TaxID=3153300 RepID=UPI003242716C
MKNIFNKIIAGVFVIGALASCEDNLDQIPFDSLSIDNAYSSPQDFENAIRGTYEGLISSDDLSTTVGMYGYIGSGSMLSAPDILSDNVTLSQNGRFTARDLHDWDYNGNSTITTVYNNAYTIIYRANLILDNADNFEDDSKANILAEAKALRAMAHLNIVSFFGKIPTQSADANSSLGVAYVTSVDQFQTPARNTVGENYAAIVKDLTEAVEDINVSNGVGRMGKNAVNLLLSRVYLYMGEWQKAADAAAEVTTAIAPMDSFVDIWDDTSTAGLIFSIPNTETTTNNAIGVSWSQGTKAAITNEYVASFELVNLFAADDVRKEAYIFTGKSQGVEYNSIRKLFGKQGATTQLSNGVVDYKILRAAEAALNRAEALYNIGGREAEARAALDELRTKRYTTPPSGETGTALRDAIRLERRLELAFEYQRFFDLKRWGLPVQRENFGDIIDGSGTPSEDLLLPAGSNLFQLPFSQTTIDKNPNIAQNPGY